MTQAGGEVTTLEGEDMGGWEGVDGVWGAEGVWGRGRGWVGRARGSASEPLVLMTRLSAPRPAGRTEDSQRPYPMSEKAAMSRRRRGRECEEVIMKDKEEDGKKGGRVSKEKKEYEMQ